MMQSAPTRRSADALLASRLDASDPAFRERPHEILDMLRADNPVYRDPVLDRVVLTRAEDVAEVLSDPTLSSDPWKARPTASARRRLTEGDRNKMPMVFRDDPDHRRLRRLIAQAFTPRAVQAMRPQIEAIASGLLTRIDIAGSFDLMAMYAAPLPSLVMADIMGVSAVDAPTFVRLIDEFMLVFSTYKTEEDHRRVAFARDGIDGIISGEIDKRRRDGGDDVIGMLVAAEADGDKLSTSEVLDTCRMLMFAGISTTSDLIGNGTVALLRHPEQLARLRRSPELWPAAVEEVLRYDSPVSSWDRQSVTDRNLGGCPVEAGQTITSMLLAANHDPNVHFDPHTLDIEREHFEHHSFGGGAHFCIGAPLARLQGRIGLSMLLSEFPDLHLVEEPKRKAMPTFNGFEAVWLRAR